MNDLTVLVQASALVFVVSSMLAMGLSLTTTQIVTPLKDARLVAIALAVNFVAVPLLAVAIQTVAGLNDDLDTGLVLVATAAGAPFLPKLAETAKGDVALSVGVMVLLMVITVVYMPIVLPLVLTGVDVDVWAIARSLIVVMLMPLATVAILLMLVGGIILSWTDIVDLVGTGGLLVAIAFLVLSLALGYWTAGADPATRPVLGLGTAQRNLSAALVVGAQRPRDPATGDRPAVTDRGHRRRATRRDPSSPATPRPISAPTVAPNSACSTPLI